MKITVLLMVAVILHVSASTLAQKVTLSVKNAPLVDVFNKINSQTGYDFLFTTSIIKNANPVTLSANNEELNEVLQKIFAGQSLDFSIENKSVVVSVKPIPVILNTGVVKAAPVLISGKVVDEKGNTIPGATIRLKGSNNAWTTNAQGQFTVVVLDPKSILIFSFVGYQAKEVAVADLKNPATIVLKEAVGSLDEVQVLAYGTTTKKLNTGNVITVTSEEIEKHPVSNVLQALQNQVPGLFIQQNTGNIGGAFSTQIRSGSSIVGSNPLFIVDGVQYPAGQSLQFLNALTNSATSNPTNMFGNALNYLNPADIESVSILKDADATALYGSRGAYGVIIITTKKGKPGDASLTINGTDGVTVVGKLPPLLNTDQYLEIRREAFKNDGVTPGPADLDLNGTWPTDRYTDWRKYYLGSSGQDQKLNLTYKGGTELSSYLMSGSLHNQRSIQKGKGGQIDGDMRFDLNSTSKNKKFFIDMTATYALSRNNAIPYDFILALTQAPNAPVPILPDGSLDWSLGTNPAAAINALYLNTNNNFLSNLTLRYNITKDLAFNAVFGYTLNTNKEFRAQPTSYFAPSATVATQATSTINTFNNRATSIDPNITYNHLFFNKLTAESRVGFTAQDGNNYVLRTTGTNFNSDQLLVSPTSASGAVVSTYANTPTRYLGAFIYGRFNWDSKYILSLNGRRDGSTAFGPAHRFGNFGSVAGAWILSEESWMKKISNVVNFAKIRASYGTTGGDQIGSYGYLNTFGITGTPYAGSIGFTPSRIANPDLHWESKKSEEIGTTLQFLKGRIEVDGSYYRSWTTDPLYLTAISSVTGFTSVTSNTPDAKLLTWGYEASLSTTNIRTRNFKWSTFINITMPHSKLLSFPGLDNLNSVNLTNINLRLGKPVTGTLLYNYAGVNPQTGNYSFINAQGVKGDFTALQMNSVTDRTEFIDRAPRYYGSFNNDFTYKNLSLGFSFIFTSRMGPTLESTQILLPGQFNVNPIANALNRWQKPGDITDEPKVSQSFLGILSKNVYSSSTGAWVNTTYARLQNLNMSYNFTGKWLAKAGIKQLSMFVRGENLFTISKYKDLDPENLNNNSLGPLRVFTGGLNITL
ncbi:SusC/RagA family TonB-linked outer membrane protein [Mucilaginibacter mali]|uniref:SusC/RagA family TonB-linked outer membrane protein n=1 Tax=Mucilaginibacter mali TaxID=2740462 RepID=A0A7D4Q439_9SPHI|nr:SusC/RagA family TonB-linked outer membrane protein [Mucilaginibacter mali]QKJ30667.1 SusC/RagA family TonB-linked outer membrane protein [Mucilaginibacter mali]